ncbi:MAG: hypothetical protein MK210_17130 [Dehalococcoidia bacterium]|nr:hypothetical protein [Dehalococcoidia bacterium]
MLIDDGAVSGVLD